jgi:hypothetical protein
MSPLKRFIINIIPVILIILIFSYSHHFDRSTTSDSSGDFIYYRYNKDANNNKSVEMHPCFNEVFKDINASLKGKPKLIQGTQNKHNVVFFENLTFLEQTLPLVEKHLMKRHNSIHFIYGMRGADYLASKSTLYQMARLYVKQSQDVEKEASLKQLFPATWTLPGEIEKLQKEFDSSRRYLLKSDQQRQTGFKITNNLEYLQKVYTNYVVCQEILEDPFLVNSRKINIRIYLLVSLDKEGTCKMHVYNDGFIYYTPKPYVENSTDKDEIITTGYIDRTVYADNPLTFKDLESYMGSDSHAKLFDNICTGLSLIKHSYQDFFTSRNKDLPGKKALLFGCDIAPCSDLSIKLMEVNKGPDLTYKDERDKRVKYNLVREMIDMHLYDCDPENFKLIGTE